MGARKWAIVPEGTHWRKRLQERQVQWSKHNLDEIHTAIEEDVYMRALNGEKLVDICRSYGIQDDREFANVYQNVWRLGHADFKNAIVQNSLEKGMNSNIPVAWIALLNSFVFGLNDKNQQVTEDADGKVEFVISVLPKVINEDDEAA